LLCQQVFNTGQTLSGNQRFPLAPAFLVLLGFPVVSPKASAKLSYEHRTVLFFFLLACCFMGSWNVSAGDQ